MAAAYGAWNGLDYQWTIGEYDVSLTLNLTREAYVDLVLIHLALYPALDTVKEKPA